MSFSPCPACRRHVRADLGACPFCGGAVVATAAPPTPKGRLGRAALFAFGTAVASTGLAGCGDLHTPDDDGGADAGVDSGGAVPPYGAPPEDGGGAVPLYGGAPED